MMIEIASFHSAEAEPDLNGSHLVRYKTIELKRSNSSWFRIQAFCGTQFYTETVENVPHRNGVECAHCASFLASFLT